MVLFDVNCSSRSRGSYTTEEVRLHGSGQIDRDACGLSVVELMSTQLSSFQGKTKVNIFCHMIVTSWQVVVEEVRHGGPGGQEADAGHGGVEAEDGPHHHLRCS